MKKRALITGIGGMDGSHLAEFLLSKDYEVFGIERRKAIEERTNTAGIIDQITFLKGDLADQNSLVRCLKEAQPHEIYNLAAQSFVEDSWDTPEAIANTTGLGVLRMLEAIREFGDNDIRFYQASSSEMFGKVQETPQNEMPSSSPISPTKSQATMFFSNETSRQDLEKYQLKICHALSYWINKFPFHFALDMTLIESVKRFSNLISTKGKNFVLKINFYKMLDFY